MTQTWHDLLFAHWPIAAHDLRAKVPAAFDLDLFRGRRLGRHRSFPDDERCPERCSCTPLAVGISRTERADVRPAPRAGPASFSSASMRAADSPFTPRARCSTCPTSQRPSISACMTGRFAIRAAANAQRCQRPWSPSCRRTARVSRPGRGSLEVLLTERYCLYNVTRRGEPYCLQIHHPPWRLRTATAEFQTQHHARRQRASIARPRTAAPLCRTPGHGGLDAGTAAAPPAGPRYSRVTSRGALSSRSATNLV